MTGEVADAKLRFLSAAACQLATTAPATSAQLILQRNLELADRSLIIRDGEWSNSCKACGTVSIPGLTSRMTIVRGRVSKRMSRSKRQGKGSAESPGKFVKVDCTACHRFEQRRLQGPISDKITKPSLTSTKSIPSEDATFRKAPSDLPPAPRTAATNASSKQRAKARKYGGLQAMLEKSKASTNSSAGFGLDLLDLMKKS